MDVRAPPQKKAKCYHFHTEWEQDFFFSSVEGKAVCLICGQSVAVGKKGNVERHFKTHQSYAEKYPKGSLLRSQKVADLKAKLEKQQSILKQPCAKANKATEASFKIAHYLTKNKSSFTDGPILKGAMTLMADTIFRDFKNVPEISSAIADVQLGASTMVRRVSALSANLQGQLERDLSTCTCFSLQCDESVDNGDTAQLALFARMVFDDFSNKEEFIALLPLKSTTKGVDIYHAVKAYFERRNVPLKKLVAITTDGAPAMTGRHSGFIASCKADPDVPPFLNYHCIIHQQAICAKVMGFDHVMTPVVKIINSIRAQAKQHRMFKLFLEELSSEYGDLLLHTQIRWLSRGKILRRFLSLLPEIKDFMESRKEDVDKLRNIAWLLDLAFLTDATGKLNELNCDLQGKDKTIADMITAVKTFKSKLDLFIQQVQKGKMHHFPSVALMLAENQSGSRFLNTEKYCNVLCRLKEEFSDRFGDFEKLEPSVVFVSNPFMSFDVCDVAEQMSGLFNLDYCVLEMEIVTIRNDVQLKSRQSDSSFWSLVDPNKYKNICTVAKKVMSLFGSTYLCESAFSDMNFIKSQFRTRLTDEHLGDSIRVALSNYTPDYKVLVDSMQCQISH